MDRLLRGFPCCSELCGKPLHGLGRPRTQRGLRTSPLGPSVGLGAAQEALRNPGQGCPGLRSAGGGGERKAQERSGAEGMLHPPHRVLRNYHKLDLHTSSGNKKSATLILGPGRATSYGHSGQIQKVRPTTGVFRRRARSSANPCSTRGASQSAYAVAHTAPEVCRSGAGSPSSNAESRTVCSLGKGAWSVYSLAESPMPTLVAPGEPSPKYAARS